MIAQFKGGFQSIVWYVFADQSVKIIQIMFRISLAAIIVSFITLFTLPSDAEAFPERERGWIFGVTGGATYMTAHALPGELSASPIIGYNGGITAERHLAQDIVFRPHVLFSEKGFAAEGEYEDEFYDFTYTSQYIDAVIPLVYSFELHSEFVPQIMLGMTMSYGIDGSYGGDFSEELPGEFDDDLGFLDVGSMFGAGGIQHFDSIALTFDVRYNFGFLDTGIHDDQSIRNQGFQVNLGLRF